MVVIAYAATDLRDGWSRIQDFIDQGCVGSDAQRGIEIDHVQSGEPQFRPTTGGPDRVGQSHAFCVWCPAHELDTGPGTEVDGWNSDHSRVPAPVVCVAGPARRRFRTPATISRKNRRPGRPLFSG